MSTGGEGGMVTTSDSALWSSMWSHKDHGKSWDAVNVQNPQTGFRWLHESFGNNWRMIEMEATIGRIQLRRMADWHARRLLNAQRLWATASTLPGLRVPALPPEIVHAAYKCYVYVEPEQLRKGWDRNRIQDQINARGVPCYAGSCSEVYLEKAFDGTGWRPAERLPVARELGETSLMFLVHPTLTEAELGKTCDVMTEVMRMAAA